MEKVYVIRNTENDRYLSSLVLGNSRGLDPLYWCGLLKLAIRFETPEQAQATISFIGDVIDFELSDQLEVVEYQL